MLVDKLVTYKALDLQQPTIPTRSRLYCLEPIGVGTPYVESLTGYVARLAQAHCTLTGILIVSKIAPLIREGYVFNGRQRTMSPVYGSNSSRRALNGTGLMASTLIQALEGLTLRGDLLHLAMITWANVLPSKGLLRAKKSWCPICYQEWRAAGHVIREPLIWTLDVVTVCPRHSQPLQTECPHCHKQNFEVLEWRSRPGYCPKCGGWLGLSQSDLAANTEVWGEDELEWQTYVVNNIGELLAAAPHLLEPLPKERIQKVISAYVHQVTEGNLSAFARLIGLEQSKVDLWYKGRSVPTLGTLLHICNQLGISLLSFLTKEFVTVDADKIVAPVQAKRQRQQRTCVSSKFDSNKAQTTLQASLNETPPPSITELRIRLKESSNGNLYNHFPDLCKLIASRHNDYKKARFKEEMQRGLATVLKSDECPFPSVRQVAKRLGYSERSLYNHFPNLCHIIAARGLSDRNAVHMESVKQLRISIRQAVLDLHAKGLPLHNRAISKLLPKPGVMRREEAQTALHEVLRELGYRN